MKYEGEGATQTRCFTNKISTECVRERLMIGEVGCRVGVTENVSDWMDRHF